MNEIQIGVSVLFVMLGVGCGILNYLDANKVSKTLKTKRAIAGLLAFVVGITLLAYNYEFLIISMIFILIAVFCRFIDYLTIMPKNDENALQDYLNRKDVFSKIFLISVFSSTLIAPLHIFVR